MCVVTGIVTKCDHVTQVRLGVKSSEARVKGRKRFVQSSSSSLNTKVSMILCPKSSFSLSSVWSTTRGGRLGEGFGGRFGWRMDGWVDGWMDDAFCMWMEVLVLSTLYGYVDTRMHARIYVRIYGLGLELG